MDLDKQLLSSLIHDGRDSLKDCIDAGLLEEHFSNPDALKAYKYLIECGLDCGGFPDIATISAKYSLEIPEYRGPAKIFAKEVRKFALLRDMTRYWSEIADVAEKDPEKGLEKWLEYTKSLRGYDLKAAHLQPIFELGAEVVADYKKMKAGATGILTPWPAINEITLGFWPEDLILFVARQAQGKSWMQLILANHAWTSGKRVLFATTEMSKLRMARRFYSISLRLPYGDLSKGRLGHFAEQKFYEGVEKSLENQGFYIIGGDFDFRAETFEAAIEECKPDIAFLDGAYLLKTSGQNRIEQASNMFNEVKRIAKRNHVPLAITHQLNRESTKVQQKDVSAANLALSDAGGWNADLIFAQFQDDDMKAHNKMKIRTLKSREGVGDEVTINWDLNLMDFREVPKDGGGDAYEELKDDSDDGAPF